MFGQKKVAMIVAEFLGVLILSLAFYSIFNYQTKFPLFTGLAAGLTLGVLVFAIGSVSEAHVNPAVTISMWVMRKVDTLRAIVYIVFQMLGGIAAWALISYLLGHSLTSMAGVHFTLRVFIAEAIGTAIFTFGAAAALIQGFGTTQRAIIFGASYAIGILAASIASNALLNPAVAVGVQSWDWTYAVAPLVGAIVGSNLYALMYASSTEKFKLASTTPKTTKTKRTSRSKKSRR